MAIKLCHHIKEDGIWCKSAALQGRDYCFFHLTFRGRRLRIAQHRARQTAWRLELPPLENLNAVQVGIMQVLDAITGDRIERHDAGLVLYGLQQAASNLRGREGRVSFEVEPSAENRCVSYDSFEEDFGLTDDETGSDEKPDAAVASAATAPDPLPTVASQAGEPVAAKKETTTEHAEAAAPSPIIIDKLMAVADDDPADSRVEADSVLPEVPDAPRKPPRGLRPPKAERQSPEAAAALAKQRQATAAECGRLDNGEITKCRDCEVKVYKRLAQYWEGRKRGDDWLPTTGTIDCLDCQLKHLTTMGRHLDEKMPPLFEIYFRLEEDGGENPGEFDDYFFKLRDCLARTGEIPEEWAERLRNWAVRDEGDEVETDDGEFAEEGEASA